MLCQLFHCLPSDLENEDLVELQSHLIIQDEVKKEEARQMKRGR
jgi:hypothetical protein